MLSSISTPSGQYTTLNLPPECCAYGWHLGDVEAAKKAGAVAHGLSPQGQLVLVLTKKGEAPEHAIERVGAKHPNVKFKRLDTDLVLTGPEFGVGEDEHDCILMDYYEDDEGLVLDYDDEMELLISRLIAASGGGKV